jgi:hypothetical protein
MLTKLQKKENTKLRPKSSWCVIVLTSLSKQYYKCEGMANSYNSIK